MNLWEAKAVAVNRNTVGMWKLEAEGGEEVFAPHRISVWWPDEDRSVHLPGQTLLPCVNPTWNTFFLIRGCWDDRPFRETIAFCSFCLSYFFHNLRLVSLPAFTLSRCLCPSPTLDDTNMTRRGRGRGRGSDLVPRWSNLFFSRRNSLRIPASEQWEEN